MKIIFSFVNYKCCCATFKKKFILISFIDLNSRTNYAHTSTYTADTFTANSEKQSFLFCQSIIQKVPNSLFTFKTCLTK